jgi:3-oxoacyl-(acyl-carrier-protein) synthase
VPNKGISMPVKVAIKESMGFGGQNAVVVFKGI